eukprot:3587554-Rhodomonas_salina.2
MPPPFFLRHTEENGDEGIGAMQDSSWYDASLWETATQELTQHLHPPTCSAQVSGRPAKALDGQSFVESELQEESNERCRNSYQAPE